MSSVKPSTRRRARETALQVLYQLDAQPELDADVALARFFASFGDDGDADLPTDGETRAFTAELVRGVAGAREAIDRRIGQASRNWRLERMARVDRNLLRLAVHELVTGSVPAKVALNEAIEIAKRFGSHETPAFINGVLDRVLEELSR